MAYAQNGWPVAEPSQMDKAPLYAGVTVPNGVLAGDVAIVFRWHAEQYHRRVEPLINGTCWGYNKKQIGGSGDWSNHAAGCAVDYNANTHNDGDPPSESFTAAQIDTCHALERESEGTLRWGGDWSDPDGMHWEIIGTTKQVAAFAAKIEGKASGMFLPVEGDQGEEVKFWQYLLKDTGYDPGAIDGDYGPKTTAAVNAWRAAHGEGPHNRITGWHARTMMREAFTG